uniref:SCAN box domain-containing protein n=1 Tax=Xenopus tropicalis TaxID=8364 RepID=A0A803JBU5_XENTR
KTNVYQEVKSAILGIMSQVYSQQFMSLLRLRVLGQQLMDFCTRWFLSVTKSMDQVIEALVLEQFLLVLPIEVCLWVQKQQDTVSETEESKVLKQMLVFKELIRAVFNLAHTVHWGGHLSNTFMQVMLLSILMTL